MGLRAVVAGLAVDVYVHWPQTGMISRLGSAQSPRRMGTPVVAPPTGFQRKNNDYLPGRSKWRRGDGPALKAGLPSIARGCVRVIGMSAIPATPQLIQAMLSTRSRRWAPPRSRPPIRSWPQAQVNEGRGADRSVGLRAVWILSTPHTRVHGRAARLRSRSCLLRGPPSTRSRRPPSTSRFRPNSPAISRSLYTDLQQHGVDARLQPGLTRDGVRRPRAATDGTEWSRPDLA